MASELCVGESGSSWDLDDIDADKAMATIKQYAHEHFEEKKLTSDECLTLIANFLHQLKWKRKKPRLMEGTPDSSAKNAPVEHTCTPKDTKSQPGFEVKVEAAHLPTEKSLPVITPEKQRQIQANRLRAMELKRQREESEGLAREEDARKNTSEMEKAQSVIMAVFPGKTEEEVCQLLELDP